MDDVNVCRRVQFVDGIKGVHVYSETFILGLFDLLAPCVYWCISIKLTEYTLLRYTLINTSVTLTFPDPFGLLALNRMDPSNKMAAFISHAPLPPPPPAIIL